MQQHPVIIQGGMGAGVSSWRLAQAVSRQGQLGVVSGTALDGILVRRLEDGDPGGHMRRGLDAFPFPAMAERIWSAWYIPGGKAAMASYRTMPTHVQEDPRELTELCIVANFVEVFLAREGHTNPVGINYLEKIQIPHLPSMYGAMLAGVGYVIMGAGIPLHVPGALDALAEHKPAEYALHVTGATEADDMTVHFDPHDFMDRELAPLHRPAFLAIVSSNTLAATMLRKANGKVDGLVIETRTAGGHNAPPRGKMQLSAEGEPIYGERDTIDFAKIRELGAPFWLAGGYGSAEKLQEALAIGATGVQVGTAFAFTRESAGPCSAGRGACLHRSARVSGRLPVQGSDSGRNCFGRSGCGCAPAHLRPRISARDVSRRRWANRLPLSRGAAVDLSVQRRKSRRR
jgi:nitronate monooxygenase